MFLYVLDTMVTSPGPENMIFVVFLYFCHILDKNVYLLGGRPTQRELASLTGEELYKRQQSQLTKVTKFNTAANTAATNKTSQKDAPPPPPTPFL